MLLMVGCGGGQSASSNGPFASADFAKGGASELETYTGVEEMVAKADRVIVGFVLDVQFGPDEGGGGEFAFKTARVFVAEKRDAAPSAEIAFLLGTAESADETFKDLQMALPKGRAAWLLRSIEVYPGVYRSVNMAGVLEEAPDGTTQPSFYRGSAEAARAGGKPEDNEALIIDLVKRRFDDIVAMADSTK